MSDILFCIRILHQPSAILFIRSQARKIDQRDRGISSTSELGWKEITDQFTSTTFYRFRPVPGVFLKIRKLVRVYLVTNTKSRHGKALMLSVYESDRPGSKQDASVRTELSLLV